MACIKFKKLHPDAVAPVRGSLGAAGFDLTAVTVRRAGDLYIYDTGLAFEVPHGYFGAIYARSSLFFTGLETVNGVGVIDSDYRGGVLVVYREMDGTYMARKRGLKRMFPGREHHMRPYEAGDRIAQIIIQPCFMMHGEEVWFAEADELSETARGTGGYGSTGR